MNYSFLKKWGIGFLLLVAVFGALRLKPWNLFQSRAVSAASLDVGFLPVT